MNNSSLGWKIFGILVSIAMIWGGLSGEFVLRGTNNSTALVVAGFVFLIWDIISIVTHKKQSDEIEEVEVPQPKVDGLVANNHSAQREPGKATYAMPPVPNAAPPAKQAYSPVDAESSIDFATPEIAVDASSESASVVERNLLAELEQEVEVTPSVEPAPAVVHIPVSAYISHLNNMPDIENNVVPSPPPPKEEQKASPQAAPAQKDEQKAQSTRPAVVNARPTEHQSVQDVVPRPAFYMLEHKVATAYHKVGEVQKISTGQVEIGRDPRCEVRFDEQFPTVSRRHATIVKEDNSLKLIPISQTNSTFVNGILVQKEWYLQHNDEIQFSVNGPVLLFRTA